METFNLKIILPCKVFKDAFWCSGCWRMNQDVFLMVLICLIENDRGMFTKQLSWSLYLNGYFGNKDVTSLKWISRGGGGRRWTGEGGDGILEGKSRGWWPMMAAHLGELVASLFLSGSLSMFRMWKLLPGPTWGLVITGVGGLQVAALSKVSWWDHDGTEWSDLVSEPRFQ